MLRRLRRRFARHERGGQPVASQSGQAGPRLVDRFLFGTGIALVAGAIVAGGLRAAGIELPAIDSPLRQVLLGSFGVGLMVLSFLVRTYDVGSDRLDGRLIRGPLVPVPGVVPRLTPYFTGREMLLNELHEKLALAKVVVLTGLGGVGKSELARAYAEQHPPTDGKVWWMRAHDATVLAEDYAAIADAERLSEPAADIRLKMAAVRRWLDATPGWLLVFDDATDPTDLEPYLSGFEHTRIVVTSQTRPWPAEMIDVPPLARQEAVTFFEEHADVDPTTADELAELLGDLPLALEQARAYLAQTHQPISEYLEKLRTELRTELHEQTKSLLQEGDPVHHTTVERTWTVSLARARQQAPAARDTLILFSFLAPEAIPRDLVRLNADVLPAQLREVLRGHGYDRVLGELNRLSLVNVTQDAITVHRLVQAIARQSLSIKDLRYWAGIAVQLLAQAFPQQSNQEHTWPECAQLLAHALATAGYAERLGMNPIATASVLNAAGVYLMVRAELVQAEHLLRRALSIRQASFAPNHPEITNTLSNLGRVLQGLGEPSETRDANERGTAPELGGGAARGRTDRILPANSGSELWVQMVFGGDIQPHGYDRSLVLDLRRYFGFPERPIMAEALERISIEHLVRAFFHVSEQYREIWKDLLQFFESIAESIGSPRLDLHYDFSVDSPRQVNFSIDSLHRMNTRARKLVALFDLSQTVPTKLWDVVRAFRSDRSRFHTDAPTVPDADRFIRACRKGSYPDRMPLRPTVVDARLDGLIAETWLLGDIVLTDLRTTFRAYNNVASFSDNPSARVPSDLPNQVLVSIARDKWLSSLVATATAEIADTGQSQARIADRLEAALQQLRDYPSSNSLQERLQELLLLPLWRHRHDLYSTWVATRLFAALEDQEVVIHSADRRIDFSHVGTHLGTFNRSNPKVHLWMESHDALATPVDRGGEGSIRPDIVLRRDPITAASIPLAIECKQYHGIDDQAVADAITHYARAHSQTFILLVNYGLGRERTVLARVAPDIIGRVSYVTDMRPYMLRSLAEFRNIVRSALSLTDMT